MSDEKKPVGYVINHQIIVDPETGEGLQMTYNAAEDATASQIAARIHVARVAMWTAKLANNQRLMMLAKRIHGELEKNIAAARAAKKPLNEKHLRQQQGDLMTNIVKLASEIRANQEVLERERTMTPEQIEARVREIDDITFGSGETTH